MTTFSRRAFALSGLAGAFALSACDNRRTNSGVDRIEARVDATLAQMYADFPKTRSIAARSTGMLVMPLITEAGLGFGGGFGRGALRIGGTTVD
ncbi:MAG: twin-arginine translocation pathway signal, partial [Planktotalea sp.]